MTKDDPVIQRIREARRKIVAEAGYDRRRLLEWAKRLEAHHRERVVGYQPRGITAKQAPDNQP